MNIIIILILALTIFGLTLIILYILHKTYFFSNDDVKLIKFLMDVYIEYGHTFDLYDEEKHNIIKNKLAKLKEKHLKDKD